MTRHELKIGVDTVDDLIKTIEAVGELGWSWLEGAKADFRAMVPKRKDLYG